jgi:hypothetical protein
MSPAELENEPSGPCAPAAPMTIIRTMSDRGLHHIADDLSESWVEDWAAVGLSEIEELLAKHAAFLGYLEATEDSSPSPEPDLI